MKCNFKNHTYFTPHLLSMIPRTILKSIEESIEFKPVTLITGARQIGKTTICKHIAKERGFNYVSLASNEDRTMAIRDPEMFLRLHPAPLIALKDNYPKYIITLDRYPSDDIDGIRIVNIVDFLSHKDMQRS